MIRVRCTGCRADEVPTVPVPVVPLARNERQAGSCGLQGGGRAEPQPLPPLAPSAAGTPLPPLAPRIEVQLGSKALHGGGVSLWCPQTRQAGSFGLHAGGRPLPPEAPD